MKLSRRALLRFFHDQNGAVGIFFGLALGTFLIAAIGLSIDVSRAHTAKMRAQQALDAALLGAVSTEPAVDNAALEHVQTETNKLFTLNFPQNYVGSRVTTVNVSKSGEAYVARVTVTLPASLISAVRQGETNVSVALSSTVAPSRTYAPLELAIILDTSLSMSSAGSGGSTRLDSAKAALNSVINTLYGSQSTLPGTYVSLVPFSDAVRIDPARSNNWLTIPFANAADHSGCMTIRNGGNRETDTAPAAGNAATLFPRYIGPFDVPDNISITGYRPDGTQVPPLHYTITPDQTPTTDGLRVDFTTRVIDSGYDRNRFSGELDYVYNYRGITGSEKLVIDYGAEYRSGVSKIRIDYMYASEGEAGRWDAFGGNNNLVGTGIFYGANAGQAFELLNIVPIQPIRRIEFTAVDNGNRTYYNSPAYWPYGSDTSQPILDNTDYSILSFNYVARCSGSQASYFMNDKSTIQAAINALSTDGPTRTDRGLAWGWYGLSPRWRGLLNAAAPSLPNDSSVNRKVAILITQGENFNPTTDDATTLNICTAMRAQNIDLYTISFDGSSAVQTLLRSCASSSDHFFNAPTPATLAAALSSIGTNVKKLRLAQ